MKKSEFAMMRTCPHCGGNEFHYNKNEHAYVCDYCDSMFIIDDEKQVSDQNEIESVQKRLDKTTELIDKAIEKTNDLSSDMEVPERSELGISLFNIATGFILIFLPGIIEKLFSAANIILGGDAIGVWKFFSCIFLAFKMIAVLSGSFLTSMGTFKLVLYFKNSYSFNHQ